MASGQPTANYSAIDQSIRELTTKIDDYNFISEILSDLPPVIITDEVVRASDSTGVVENKNFGTGDKPTINVDTNVSASFGGSKPTISTPGITISTVGTAPTAPTFSFGTAPTSTIPTAPTEPTLQSTAVPSKPTYEIPSIPELAAVTVPTLSVPELPAAVTELATLNNSDAQAPALDFEYEEEEYYTLELQNLRNLINDDLVNGGWGITHQDEEDLFTRQRERIRDESLMQEEDLFDSFAARGFDIPQGDQIDQVRVLQKQTLDKLEEANLDISNKRAELIRQSRENIISQANQLNQVMTTYAGFMHNRLLDAAKFLVQYSIDKFNAQVERYNLVIAEYNARVSGYQARVDAAQTQVQISKTEIEAAALVNDINRSEIEVYQAQLQGLSSLVNLYQAEIDASRIASELERDKLEIFRSQVEAYKSQIDAETSKAQLYNAQIAAEEVKARVYSSEVDAYEARARVINNANQASIEEARLDIQTKGLKLEQYRADIDKYRADIEESSRSIDHALSEAQIKSSVYATSASYAGTYLAALASEQRENLTAAVEQARLDSESSRYNADLYDSRVKLQIGSAQAAATAYAEQAKAFASFSSTLDIGTT